MATTETETEESFTQLLMEVLLEADDNGTLDLGSVNSFAEAGVMTLNEGLVVRLASGEEFQVTVVRSR